MSKWILLIAITLTMAIINVTARNTDALMVSMIMQTMSRMMRRSRKKKWGDDEESIDDEKRKENKTNVGCIIGEY